MIQKLRLKFVCINMIIVTAMLGIIFSLLFVFVGMTTELQGRQAIQEITEMSLRFDRRPEQIRPIRRPYFLAHWNTDGSVDIMDRGFFQDTEEETLEAYAQMAMKKGENSGTLLSVRLRYQILENPFGKTLVFADISGEILAMENLLKGSLVIAGLSFCAFLAISILLARWAVKPVEEAWNRQNRFVADASHELKTPLTVIMTNAELLQSRTSEEEPLRFVESILTMTRQMRALVESLLELARLDSGAGKMLLSELDFSELVSEGLLPFEPVYFERGLLLNSNIEEGLRVKGSASHLRQVLDVLLDNGAKYASAGSGARMELKKQGNHCILRMDTHGEGISREDCKLIFERFYRTDPARTGSGSYGLGLPIAKSIITEHGGRIWAESNQGVNSFFVQLPLVAERSANAMRRI